MVDESARPYPQFWLYGDTPIKMERTADGGLRVLAFQDGALVLASHYRSVIFHDRDDLAHRIDEGTWTRLTGGRQWSAADELNARREKRRRELDAMDSTIRRDLTFTTLAAAWSDQITMDRGADILGMTLPDFRRQLEQTAEALGWDGVQS